jgi:hypothetical protein
MLWTYLTVLDDPLGKELPRETLIQIHCCCLDRLEKYNRPRKTRHFSENLRNFTVYR